MKITVVSAEQQVVAGMNYKVTINIKCACGHMDTATQYSARDAVISYFMPLGESVPSDLQLIEDNAYEECASDLEEDESAMSWENARSFRLLRIVIPAVVVIGICVCLGVFLKKRRNKSGDNYSEMYTENDAIEAGL